MVIGVNEPDLEGSVRLGIMIRFLLPVADGVRATNRGEVIKKRRLLTMGDDKGEVSVAMQVQVMTGTDDDSRLTLDVRGGSFLDFPRSSQPCCPKLVFSRLPADNLGARVLLLRS
jgi:hypothetical protein